ncbi:MAG: 50S ribosomal protein L13 [Nanoarchaeota archaeon]
MEEIVIDASNNVAGRLASKVAKEALKGKRIFIVNAEKCVFSGSPKVTEAFFSEKVKRGDPYHGPFYPKTPDSIFKRIVRGMLPYRTTRGREALNRIKVYTGMPDEFKNREIKDLGTGNKLKYKYMTLEKVCEKLRGKR